MVPSIAKWMNTGAILVTMIVLGYFIAKSSAQPGALPRTVNPERSLEGIIPPPQKIAQTSVLTKDEVNQVAKQTTVLVANGLVKGDDPTTALDPGSGILISKIGKTYYVATNLHVVAARGSEYGVRTYDGEVYFVPYKNIYTFGKQDENTNRIEGFDLAIIQFESQKNYPIAKVNLGAGSVGEPVFVSGWPDPEDKSPRRDYRFSQGKVTSILTVPDPDGGYGLYYSAATRRGMSGGPVFNTYGEVVGIHGRGGTATKQIVNISNLGILVTYLVNEAKKSQLQTFIPPNYSPTEPRAMIGAPIPVEATVVPNIYQSFTRDFIPSSTRDCPSGGSGSLLLGGSDDQCN